MCQWVAQARFGCPLTRILVKHRATVLGRVVQFSVQGQQPCGIAVGQLLPERRPRIRSGWLPYATDRRFDAARQAAKIDLRIS
jgi:hypothetical protein